MSNELMLVVSLLLAFGGVLAWFALLGKTGLMGWTVLATIAANIEVLILVDTIERPEEIDINRARRDADAAKEALLQKRSIQEYHTAQANLSRALNRLQLGGRWKP